MNLSVELIVTIIANLVSILIGVMKLQNYINEKFNLLGNRLTAVETDMKHLLQEENR